MNTEEVCLKYWADRERAQNAIRKAKREIKRLIDWAKSRAHHDDIEALIFQMKEVIIILSKPNKIKTGRNKGGPL